MEGFYAGFPFTVFRLLVISIVHVIFSYKNGPGLKGTSYLDCYRWLLGEPSRVAVLHRGVHQKPPGAGAAEHRVVPDYTPYPIEEDLEGIEPACIGEHVPDRAAALSGHQTFPGALAVVPENGLDAPAPVYVPEDVESGLYAPDLLQQAVASQRQVEMMALKWVSVYTGSQRREKEGGDCYRRGVCDENVSILGY